VFDDTLLDSSPSRVPVLQGIHYSLGAVAGGLGFLAAFYLLPLFFGLRETKLLVIQAAIVGVVSICYALMLCYVWADARHAGLSGLMWLAVTLVLNLVGLLIYLTYSAAKTGNWKRATVPIAYLGEVFLVGVLVLLPLIYTEALPKSLLIGDIHIAPSPPPPSPRAIAARAKLPRHATVDLMKPGS